MTGLFNDKLVLDDVEFTSLDLPKKLEFGQEIYLEVTNIPYTYQIPNFNENCNYFLALLETSLSQYSELIGYPLSSDYYSISSTGLLTLNVIIGKYILYEVKGNLKEENI